MTPQEAAELQGGVRPVVTPEGMRKLPATCIIKQYGKPIAQWGLIRLACQVGGRRR